MSQSNNLKFKNPKFKHLSSEDVEEKLSTKKAKKFKRERYTNRWDSNVGGV